VLGDNTGGRGHVATDQVPLCWSLDFNWTSLCVRVVHHMRANFDLRKILVVLDHLERSCCVSCGMSVCNIQLNK
jgi:hypothetical protein